MLTVHGTVSGVVQGVGFRYFIKRHASSVKVAGYAKNLANGNVEFLLQGDDDAVKKVLKQIAEGPSFSNVENVDANERSPVNTVYGFEVV